MLRPGEHPLAKCCAELHHLPGRGSLENIVRRFCRALRDIHTIVEKSQYSCDDYRNSFSIRASPCLEINAKRLLYASATH